MFAGESIESSLALTHRFTSAYDALPAVIARVRLTRVRRFHLFAAIWSSISRRANTVDKSTPHHTPPVVGTRGRFARVRYCLFTFAVFGAFWFRQSLFFLAGIPCITVLTLARKPPIILRDTQPAIVTRRRLTWVDLLTVLSPESFITFTGKLIAFLLNAASVVVTGIGVARTHFCVWCLAVRSSEALWTDTVDEPLECDTASIVAARIWFTRIWECFIAVTWLLGFFWFRS